MRMLWLDIKEFFKDTFIYIIIIISILFIAMYVITLQQVVGPSMANTLNNNDIVVLDRLSIDISKIKRNDVVAFYFADTKYMIKRVIGLPGDNVYFKDNLLYINGIQTDESYLPKSIITEDFDLSQIGYDKIPDDMYFVLGDNRGESMDSRDSKVGLIKRSEILGKVRLRLWPLNQLKFIK